MKELDQHSRSLNGYRIHVDLGQPRPGHVAPQRKLFPAARGSVSSHWPFCRHVSTPASPWGVPGVAWSWLIGFPLTVALKMVLVNRLLDLTLAGYLSALRPALMACLAASAVVLLVRSGLPMSWSPEARLALEVSPGAFIYVAVLLGIFRVRVTTIYETIRVGVRSPHEDAGAITT